MPEKEIIVKNLTKNYGKVVALNDVSFDVGKGEFFVVIGPSPSGKSTLLRMLMGLEEPTSGKIFIGRKDMAGIPPYNRDISLMFQTFALFSHMNVWENIAFGLKMRGAPKSEIEDKVGEVINLIGIKGLEKRFVRELSGGQQQRVALARSLVVKPRVLLLDEPMGNLDYKLQKKLELEIKLLHQQLGITFIYVTHNQDQAMSLADRLMVINQGAVEQIGAPSDVYEYPSSIFVAGFVGEVNMLLGKVIKEKRNTATVETEVGTVEGSVLKERLSSKKVTYTVRPEDVFIEPKKFPNRIKAKYIGSLYRGQEVEYVFQLPDKTEFKVFKVGKQIVDLKAKIGDIVVLGWNSNKAVILDR